MKSEYRAFWQNKMWEVMQIDYRNPQTVILSDGKLVKYGTYEAYCPADEGYMDNVGFYVEAVGYPQMPVGPLSDYAKVIGNMWENSEWLD